MLLEKDIFQKIFYHLPDQLSFIKIQQEPLYGIKYIDKLSKTLSSFTFREKKINVMVMFILSAWLKKGKIKYDRVGKAKYRKKVLLNKSTTW